MSLVLVLTLLGVTITREVQAYRHSGDTVDAVVLALAVQDVLHEAQRERGLSNGWLGGDGRLQNSVIDQRGNTDRALQALDKALDGQKPGAAQVRSALGQFAALSATRAEIDARRIARPAAFQFYTDGINALNHLRLGLDQAGDAEVRHGLQTLYALGEAKEQTAKERGFLNGVFAADEFGPGEYVQFLDIRAAKMAGLAAFARDATSDQQARLDAVLAGENASRATESENVAIQSTAGPLVRSVDPFDWWSRMTAVIDEERAVQQVVGDAVRDRAADLRRDAASTLGGFLVAALLAIAAQIALVVASMRAIVRPLAALAAEADQVASHRLPEVIAAWHDAGDNPPDPPAPVCTPPGASREIAAVAGALDRVQSTAFELASEQAVMRRNSTESMSNLARRNQNLVRRQLGLISEFEQEELDPKALSNLFELDHLATRMRRNAESLLVLVGEGSPRRWAEPIPLTDVIRAGLSEVDDYRRVMLRRIDDVAITGAVVTELAHMLAELIENGLAFSPPDLEVEIYGRKLPNGYLLAVVDHGVGMPADQLAEANARLRGERDFLVAPTRYLGHYVVGRLARRLNIDVELNTSPVSGIAARLLIPGEILDGEHGKSDPNKGERAAREELSLFAFTDPEGGVVAPAAAGTAPAHSTDPGETADGRRPAHSAPDGAGFGLPAAAARNGWTGPGPAHAAGGSPRTTDAGHRADDLGHTVGDSMRNGRDIAPTVTAAASATPTPDERRHYSNTPVDSAQNGHGAMGREAGAPGRGAEQAPEHPTKWWNVPENDTPASDSAAPVQRTRNGLVKRNKRHRVSENVAAVRPMPPRPPAPERSPEDVRGMLSAFRTGIQRGAVPVDRAADGVASPGARPSIVSPDGPLPSAVSTATRGQESQVRPPGPTGGMPSAHASPAAPASRSDGSPIPHRRALSLDTTVHPASGARTGPNTAGTSESATRAGDPARGPLDN
ncbi:nitrate- and nitrite sensing domain-containing protein [Nocardia sp. NPDC005366]|uniref:sensor histidine kinase n=1 Tax=Nocardia sp. NPDC005366 TaxID=3156878 RepID=UPI00339EF54C